MPVTEVRAQAQPPDQLTVAFDVSIAPSFLEPAETPGIGTPFVFLYALHDALVKPLAGNDMAPCLAESWKESADGLTYEFKLRELTSSSEKSTAAERRQSAGTDLAEGMELPQDDCAHRHSPDRVMEIRRLDVAGNFPCPDEFGASCVPPR